MAIETGIHPAIGPTAFVLLGLYVPIAAMTLAVTGLLLARYISPRSSRNLTKGQEWGLTGLLVCLLVAIVSGNMPFLGAGEPLDVGTATVWGIGLGTSGLLVVDFLGKKIMALIKAMGSNNSE